MQLLSHGLVLGAQGVPPVDPNLEEWLQQPVFAGLLFVGLILLQILACWFASKAVAHAESATLGKAILLIFCESILFVMMVIAVSVLFPVAAHWQPIWRQAAIVVGVVIVVAASFMIPMKIYSIGFWRSFVLFLFASGIESAVLFSVQKATGLPVLSAEDIADLSGKRGAKKELWTQFFRELTKQEEPDEIDRLLDEATDTASPRKSLTEREAAVGVLQKKLGDRKLALPPGDADAAATFQRQLDRYLQFLQEVKTERSAAPPTGAH